MRSIFKKVILAVLVCTLMLGTLAGCASKGKTLMTLDGEKMSINTVMLLMSRMKGNISSASSYGSAALNDSFWDTILDTTTKQTYDKYYTNLVLDSAKTYLAALAYFEELGLELPKETIDEIDEEMKMLVDYDGDGSKNAFNSVISEFGANYDILRDSYIMEAKIAYLNDYLFGTDGSKIADKYYTEYYEENYVRFRQIFFFTQKPKYNTDARGDVIYYSDLQNKRIAYNINAEGAYRSDKKDANGDFIYLYKDKDGYEHVSYDTTATPDPVLDANGDVVTEKLSTSDLIKLSDKVQIIMEDEAKAGEYALFDTLVDKYSELDASKEYSNGYYMTKTSDYDAPEVIEEVFKMQDGEIKRIESEYGVHIVMKYPLDSQGYAKEENKDFFRSESGTYTFLSIIKNRLIESYVADYKARIVVDEELLATLSMKNVGANYHY